jgi:hypothetical protein
MVLANSLAEPLPCPVSGHSRADEPELHAGVAARRPAGGWAVLSRGTLLRRDPPNRRVKKKEAWNVN